MEAGKVDHPILMTECICNPVSSRVKMAELLFETYGVPSVGMKDIKILTLVMGLFLMHVSELLSFGYFEIRAFSSIGIGMSCISSSGRLILLL